jgi:metallo-beta-lactamase class B
MRRLGAQLVCVVVAMFVGVQAQERGASAQPHEWRQRHGPVAIFGNTYYVGTRGLGAVLITSPTGAVLIDGALRESADAIAANITALGVPLHDVKLILNSHVHFDHAGGIAELQRRTGATVGALPWSARILQSGRNDRQDPQYASVSPVERVDRVRIVGDGEALRAGDVTVTAHRTAGHTPGGTTWTWRSCEADRCLDLVYADSITAVSDDGFRFTDSSTYPEAIADFRKAFAFLRTVNCDILLTPHPEASDFWKRSAKRDAGDRDAFVGRTQCAQYADRGEAQLEKRLQLERGR